MNLCKYKDMFGAPNTGAHSFRIMNIAIVDVVATMLLAYLIKYFVLKKIELWKILLSLFTIGIISHRLFCVRTTIDKLIWPDQN